MRWDKERVVAVSFILLSVGSVAFLSVSTLNYLNYYPALGRIQVQIDSVSIVPRSGQSMVNATVTVLNPTDYSGFRLGNAIVDLSFGVMGGNATLFGGGFRPQQVQFIGGLLGANSAVSSNVIVRLNPSNASSLASFVGSYDGQVIAKVALSVEIITFLVTVYGREYYLATQYLPLATM